MPNVILCLVCPSRGTAVQCRAAGQLFTHTLAKKKRKHL